MQGRASATSLLRLVLCAGFLCVAWLLLSPGEAQASERARPDIGGLVTGLSGSHRDGAGAEKAPGAASATPQPVARLVTSVEKTTAAPVREVSEPVHATPRPAPGASPAPEPDRPAERVLEPVRAAVRPVADEVGGEVDAVVREAQRAVTSTLTTATASVPVLREPVNAATKTVCAVTDAVLGARDVVVVPPVLPDWPRLPSPPAVVGTPALDAPALGVAREGGQPVRPSAAGTTSSVAAKVVSHDVHRTPAGAICQESKRSAARIPVDSGAPARDGGAQDLGGMPLGNLPSGSNAFSAAGYGGGADAVLPWHGLDVPRHATFLARGDDTAAASATHLPGSRPD